MDSAIQCLNNRGLMNAHNLFLSSVSLGVVHWYLSLNLLTRLMANIPSAAKLNIAHCSKDHNFLSTPFSITHLDMEYTIQNYMKYKINPSSS